MSATSKKWFSFYPAKRRHIRLGFQALNISRGTLLRDPHVVVFIEQPEKVLYSADGDFRLLISASTNYKKHSDNWHKYGITLVK